MMPATRYRLYFDDNPATRKQVDSVEEITVEQEVDMAWEARLEIPVCVDDKGNWKGENKEFMRPFSRVRVEVQVGNKPYVPLIDGPIVAPNNNKRSEPGQSSITLVVRDDSVCLNRKEEIASFEGPPDHEIAEQLFGGVPEITKTEIERAAPRKSIGNLPPVLVLRGTAMQMLRLLARDQGMHAFVLPGDEPGQSIGCFKRFSTKSSGLPPLVLLGKDRNMETLDITNDAESPSKFQASFLDVADKGVVVSTSGFDNLELLGPELPFDFDPEDVPTQIAPPGTASTVDTGRRAEAEVERANYAFEAIGSVLPGCYPAVLQPYHTVSVRAINDRLSGNYMIRRVTHTLTRSRHFQSFTLIRNARSDGASNAFSDSIGKIF
jgi:hypothetical protein